MTTTMTKTPTADQIIGLIEGNGWEWTHGELLNLVAYQDEGKVQVCAYGALAADQLGVDRLYCEDSFELDLPTRFSSGLTSGNDDMIVGRDMTIERFARWYSTQDGSEKLIESEFAAWQAGYNVGKQVREHFYKEE